MSKKIIACFMALVMVFGILVLSGCEEKESGVRPPERTSNQETGASNTEEVLNSDVLTDEDVLDAKKAAMTYYENSAYDVVSMELLEKDATKDADGECKFTVVVSKADEVQEANRNICLSRKNNGKWKVVNEGLK